MMKTVAVIQARMGSERLPGKVMMDIGGKPMLYHVIHRIGQCRSVDQVVVATSEESSDDAIEQFCINHQTAVVRGSECDVLSRFVVAAKETEADLVVRITADCPLIDPEIVDRVVDQLLAQKADYASNFHPYRLFPRGLDAEALTTSTLLAVNDLATEDRFREHVTLMIYEQANRFKKASVLNSINHSHLRWTVDTPEDLQLVRTIFKHFEGTDMRSFRYADIMRALASNWHWCQINSGIHQKAA